MDKRWYPVALSAVMVGCGGDTFSGGAPTGGGSSIDGGTPVATGGNPTVFYGVMTMSGGKASALALSASNAGKCVCTMKNE